MALEITLAPGTIVDDAWRVDAALGGGGMGSVYACTHVRNGLRVAIKVLHAHAAKDPSLRGRFLAEGQALNRVNHAGVVRALGDGVIDGSPYLIMELAVGRSLKEVAASLGGVIAAAPLRPLIDELLDALTAVHAAGIIHRDVKPDNIIVTHESRIKLVDFGIARVEESSGDTSTGTVLGTAAFMAPEQVLGKQGMVDARADIFAVGAVIFRLLSGKNLHQNATGMELLIAMGTRQAPSIRTVAPNLDKRVAAVVDRALAFERTKRFQTASQMRAAWNAAFDGQSQVPAPRRWPTWIYALLGLSVAGLAIGGALLFTASGDEPTGRKAKASGSAAPRAKATKLCEKDVDEIDAFITGEGLDAEYYLYSVTINHASASGVAKDGRSVMMYCGQSAACFRTDGGPLESTPPPLFSPEEASWRWFRKSCNSAETTFEFEHKLRGKATSAQFDRVTHARWTFSVEGGKESSEYCYSSDGRSIVCYPVTPAPPKASEAKRGCDPLKDFRCLTPPTR